MQRIRNLEWLKSVHATYLGFVSIKIIIWKPLESSKILEFIILNLLGV